MTRKFAGEEAAGNGDGRGGFRGNVGEEEGRSLECGEGWAARLAGDGGGRDERKGRSVEEMISPEVKLGMAGDGDGGGDGGTAVLRRWRRHEDGGAQ